MRIHTILLVTALAASTIAAGPGKTTVCHQDGGGDYRALSVSTRGAEHGHSRHEADGAPGGEVPGRATHAFDDDCQPTRVVLGHANTLDGDIYTITTTDDIPYAAVPGNTWVGDIAGAGVTHIIESSGLSAFDPATNEATLIDDEVTGNGLAVGPDGMLWVGAWTVLGTVDPDTGATTLVGDFGDGLSSGGDLAFGPDGTLWAGLYGNSTHYLATLDTDTGAATVVAAVDHAIYGMFFADGTLYTTSPSYPGCSAGALHVVDVTTATTALVRCLSFVAAGASPAAS